MDGNMRDSGGLQPLGGEPEQLTTPNSEQGEADHYWPEILGPYFGRRKAKAATDRAGPKARETAEAFLGS